MPGTPPTRFVYLGPEGTFTEQALRTIPAAEHGLRTPARLMDAQMGHADGSVQALYSHVTERMLRELLDGLSHEWAEALTQRRQFSPRSPVAVLDKLLTGSGQ